MTSAQTGGLHSVAGETRDRYRWVVLALTSIGALLAALTSGTLVIALSDILRDLHTDLFTLMWIVVGYTLTATVLVLNAGRIADQVGRARSYTAGFALFTLASAACVPAPTAFLLIIAPAQRGMGAGTRMMLTQTGFVISIALSIGLVASAVDPTILLAIFSGPHVGAADIDMAPFIDALHIAFVFGVVASLLGAVVSASRGGEQAVEDDVAVGRQVAA